MAIIIVALNIVIDVVEGDQNEDVFVPPGDADPVRGPAAAVSEAEDTQADARNPVSLRTRGQAWRSTLSLNQPNHRRH